VAFEVAEAIGAELDVLVARKLGVPGHAELAFGAIADGERVLDDDTIAALGLRAEAIAEVERDERAEAKRRLAAYRGSRAPPIVEGRIVILVDDGVATGNTAKAALRALRHQSPKLLVFAAPVGSRHAQRELEVEADQVELSATPRMFGAVGYWYEEFEATSDDQVVGLLEKARKDELQPAAPAAEREVAIGVGDNRIDATLVVPAHATGLVVFAHGSGSTRRSERNRSVAGRLHAQGIVTLMADLLTPEEAAVDERTREHRFDIQFLARRVRACLAWARRDARLAGLPVGLFGSSTGAAAALVAAAGDRGVGAIVSRGGRPDLAGDELGRVHAPTLLLVGGADLEVLELNRLAQRRLAGPAKVEVVTGATHLFEEPGALDAVAGLARDWFVQHLGPVRPPRPWRRTASKRAVGVEEELRERSSRLDGTGLAGLVDRIGASRIVLLGEATHGTSEFYDWRARISLRLIRDHGFRFVAVEGDWPDCFRLNRFVKDDPPVGQDVSEVLREFQRWPTWMWANQEIAGFLTDLRQWNRDLGDRRNQAGFYGLDVYSLWESLRSLASSLRGRPDAADAVDAALRCFQPYGEDGQAYATSTSWLPADCRDKVLEALVETRTNLETLPDSFTEARFDAEQNALVAVNCEAYYRAMVRGGPGSWNLRDTHMLDTLDRLLDHHGPKAKGIVWAHNTHVGDARATDMADAGMVNLGQLARERWPGQVCAVGFTTYEGNVIAGRAWDAPMRRMPVPPARKGSLEETLHRLGGDRIVDLAGLQGLREPMPHRAIGVVYHPEREAGNYVPTVVPQRYDALVHVDHSDPVKPLHIVAEHLEPPETYPWGT